MERLDDDIIPPDPVDPVDPIIPTYPISCGLNQSTGSTSGIRRYRINLAGREYGDVSVNITDILVPMKMRIYNEGATAGAYQTKGRDSYASQWLAATGEDATDLTSRVSGVFPAISNTFVYTYNAAESSVYGDNLILELSMPITVANPKFVVSCLAEIGAVADPEYVYTMTIEHRDFSSLEGVIVKVNDVAYDLNTDKTSGAGIRLVWDNASPPIAPATNDFPYPQTGNLYRRSHLEWNYSGMNITYLAASEFRQLGQSVTIDTSLGQGTFNLVVRMEKRPVTTISGVRTLLPSVLGFSALPYIAHGFWGDSTNIEMNFDAVTLRPFGSIIKRRNGTTFPPEQVSKLTNQI